MTFKFTCASCPEHTSVTAGSRTQALAEIKRHGWGGVIRQHCPTHQDRIRRMYNVR